MIPETSDIGFKEWAGVCSALESGRQAIIVRKGGISESSGPGLFEPEHSAFWLYPTRLHESEQGLRETATASHHAATIPPGCVPISAFAVVKSIGRIDDETGLDALRDLHVWTDGTIHKRFHYRVPGLWVLALRVYKRDTPYILKTTLEQEGCKSWVPLGESFSTRGVAPVLHDSEWEAFEARLDSALARST